MAAMVGVAKFVRDPATAKILSDADGIGTSATRPAIIETLFERGFAVRRKKTIVSTPTGRALIDSLPAVATTPDMTAVSAPPPQEHHFAQDPNPAARRAAERAVRIVGRWRPRER
jgi:DNA topoisomerase